MLRYIAKVLLPVRVWSLCGKLLVCWNRQRRVVEVSLPLVRVQMRSADPSKTTLPLVTSVIKLVHQRNTMTVHTRQDLRLLVQTQGRMWPSSSCNRFYRSSTCKLGQWVERLTSHNCQFSICPDSRVGILQCCLSRQGMPIRHSGQASLRCISSK